MLHISIVSYVWSNTYISNIHPIFWLIGHKSSGNCQNFIICILHMVSMYSHIQIVHMVWPVVLKPMAIIEISSFSLASYVASCVMYIQIQKTCTISPLVWLVGCKSRGNYRNFDNVPSIFHCLAKFVKPSV